MSIREVMNRHPGITTFAMIPILLAAVAIVIYWQMPEKPRKVQTQSFYTVDDGKTWFADKADKIPPFNKDGKEAVAAYVFQCGSAAPFVGYLECMAPDAKKKLDEISAAGVGRNNAAQYGMLRGMGVQRKKPGDTKWAKITEDNATYLEVANVNCKDGKPAAGVSPEIP